MSMAAAGLSSSLATKLAKLKRESRPIRFLASRFLWHSGLCSFLTIPCGDYRLRFYPSACSATLWLDPRERLQDEAVVRQLVTTGDVVVVVGANIGAIALAAARAVGQSGHVYSVEAHPRTYKYLLGNLQLNQVQNVTTFNVACGKASGSVSFSNRRSDDQNSVVHAGIPVPLRRLDELIPDRPIKLLKIDVEGYEKFVMEGATNLFKNVEFIYFESYARHFDAFGYCLKDILAFLRQFNFSAHRGNGEEVADSYNSLTCENLLAKRIQKL